VDSASLVLLSSLVPHSHVHHFFADPVRAPSRPVGRRAAATPGAPAWRGCGRSPLGFLWVRPAVGRSPEPGQLTLPRSIC
jgi:hypothetical protein